MPRHVMELIMGKTKLRMDRRGMGQERMERRNKGGISGFHRKLRWPLAPFPHRNTVGIHRDFLRSTVTYGGHRKLRWNLRLFVSFYRMLIFRLCAQPVFAFN